MTDDIYALAKTIHFKSNIAEGIATVLQAGKAGLEQAIDRADVRQISAPPILSTRLVLNPLKAGYPNFGFEADPVKKQAWFDRTASFTLPFLLAKNTKIEVIGTGRSRYTAPKKLAMSLNYALMSTSSKWRLTRKWRAAGFVSAPQNLNTPWTILTLTCPMRAPLPIKGIDGRKWSKSVAIKSIIITPPADLLLPD